MRITYLALLLISGHLYAQTSAIDKSYLKKAVKTLTADSMQGRYPGTPGIERAAGYIEAQFREAGLTDVRREEFTLIEKGWGDVYIASAKRKFLNPDDIIFHGSQAIATETQKELVFGGYGSVNELTSIDVKDRVVLVFVPNLRSFSDIAIRLRKQEASALLVANVENAMQFESIRKTFKDHVTQKRLLLEASDTIQTRPAWDTLRHVNTFVIKNELVQSLANVSINDLRRSADTKSIKDIPVSHILLKAVRNSRSIRAANIVGQLKGILDSTIIISAHYDHMGSNAEGTFYGADDNASGTAGIISMAKEYAHARLLKYSMTFLAVTAEEEGRLGSIYHVNSPNFNPTKVVFNLNLDMIGGIDGQHRQRDSYIYCVSHSKQPPQLALLEKAASINEIGIDHSLNGSIGFFQRSDQYSFYERGIPSIHLFSGVHTRYHTSADTHDQLNYALLERRVKFASSFIQLMQSGDVKFHTAIFAHNDYEKPQPFVNAWDLGAEYIEADVFLRDGNLLVAHEASQIDPRRTLASLYLEQLLIKTKEDAFNGRAHPVKLMIDLKTSGNTLKTLIDLVSKFPELISNKNLLITVSGGYPSPGEWNQYPDFIHFDGRPGVAYTPEQLKRITLISNGFGSYSKWNGEGELPAADKEKLQKVVNESHVLGKPFRFWAIPDNENSWKTMLSIGVDIINTDRVKECSTFLHR